MTNGRDTSSDDEAHDRKVVQAYRAASDVLDERTAPASRAAILAAAARAVDARPRDADEPFVPLPEELRMAAARRVASAPMAASASASMSPPPVRKPTLSAARRPLALAASFLVGGVALVVAFNVQRDPSFDEKPSSPLATAGAPASKEAASAVADTDKHEAAIEPKRAVAPSDAASGNTQSAQFAKAEPRPAPAAAAESETGAARRDTAAYEAKAKEQLKKVAEAAAAPAQEADASPQVAQAASAPARNEAQAPSARALVLEPPAASPAAPPPPAVVAPAPKADAPAGLAAASPPAAPAASALADARDALRAKEAPAKPALEEPRAAMRVAPAGATPDVVGRVRAQPTPAQSMVRARPVERTAPIAAADRAFESDPARWIERVLTLRAAGRDDEADRELTQLRERYPSFDVPAGALRRAGTR